MKIEHLNKKLRLSIILVMVCMLSMISIAVAMQHHANQTVGSASGASDAVDVAEVALTQESVDANANQSDNEIVEPDTSEQVTEEPKVIASNQSSENEAEDNRVNSSVSRGTQTTSTTSNTSQSDISNFWKNRSTWLQPLKGLQTADPTGGARYFGAARDSGERAHAAVDFIAPSGRLVYAMTDGTVTRVSLFFENTSAVEVKNTDGTVARYCEIDPSVSVNTVVHRGDVIGKIITNYAGTSMLHLEMYMGTATGSLSQSNNHSYSYVPVRNYERRSDLIDPTGAIYLPTK
jgi:Membrane proteins related to metalloendopeptidases